MIWPIKIPIPRVLGVGYRRLIDGVEHLLGFGPLDFEGPIWGGNSDGTRQNAVTETGVTDAAKSVPAPDVAPSGPGVPSAPASSEATTTVNGSGSGSTADAEMTAKQRIRDKEKGIPRHFKLGLVTAPPAGVLLLLASTCITGRTVREGIVAEPIRPFDVMILFLSFAYIALSLDQVGLLRYLAFLVAKKATDHTAAVETPSATPGATPGQTPGPSGRATPTNSAIAPGATAVETASSETVAAGEGSGRARRRKGKSAQPVFAALYALFIFISAVAGNDPIVLSGTPFVAYFSRTSGSPAEPYAFMEIYAANLASAILVSSNPTNLVLSAAFGLSFLQYSAWMVLPTLAAAVVLYPVIALQYRAQLRRAIRPPDVDPRSALVDPAGAVWASTVFILAVVVLVVLSATGQLHGAAGVWSVAAPAAVLVALRDMWHDWRHRGQRGKDVELDDLGQSGQNGASGERGERGVGQAGECTCSNGERRSYEEEEKEDEEDVDGELELHIVRPVMKRGMRRRLSSRVCRSRPSPAALAPLAPLTPLAPLEASTSAVMPSTPSASTATVTPGSSSGLGTSIPTPASSSTAACNIPRRRRRRRRRPRHHPIHWFRRTFPTVSSIVPRLPFPLVLFALSFFILVRSLETWIGIWARWWAIYVARTGLAGAIFMLALLSVVGSNFCGTNIGSAVLWQQVLVEWKRAARAEGGDVDQRILYASMLTLATGCNYGAYSFTFSASLAGLLWKDLLFARGIRVRIGQFCVNNLVPLSVTMLVSCLIIAAEVCVML